MPERAEHQVNKHGDGRAANRNALQKLREESPADLVVDGRQAGQPEIRIDVVNDHAQVVDIDVLLRIQIHDRLIPSASTNDESREDRRETVGHDTVVRNPRSGIQQARDAIEKRRERARPKSRPSGSRLNVTLRMTTRHPGIRDDLRDRRLRSP